MWVNGIYDEGLGAAGVVAAAGGPIGIAIAAGTAVIPAIIGLFSAHKAKVQREDQISNAWAQSGPQAIEDVVAAWRTCQIQGGEAIKALKEIEAQFRQMTTPIVKYRGKWGVFPDPNAPRPPKECNWACGTSWDLHKQINDLIAEIQRTEPCPPEERGVFGGSPTGEMGNKQWIGVAAILGLVLLLN